MDFDSMYTTGLQKVGFVPFSDVAAQRRCTEYLEESVKKLEETIEHEKEQSSQRKPEPGAVPDNTVNELKNTLTILTNTGGVVQPSKGMNAYKNYTYRQSKKFWDYWDKIKKQVIEINEGDSRETGDFNERMAAADALESGRTTF